MNNIGLKAKKIVFFIFLISLFVLFVFGCSSEDDALGEPVADINAGPVNFQQPPAKVLYDASRSSSPNGKIVNYDWDFGDGNTGKGELTEHIYRKEGEFKVELTVTDVKGEKAVATQIIEINPDTENTKIPISIKLPDETSESQDGLTVKSLVDQVPVTNDSIALTVDNGPRQMLWVEDDSENIVMMGYYFSTDFIDKYSDAQHSKIYSLKNKKDNSFEINAKSTTLAMAMLNPVLAGSTDELRLKFADRLISDPHFSDLVSKVRKYIKNKDYTSIDKKRTLYEDIFSFSSDIILELLKQYTEKVSGSSIQIQNIDENELTSLPRVYPRRVENGQVKIVNTGPLAWAIDYTARELCITHSENEHVSGTVDVGSRNWNNFIWHKFKDWLDLDKDANGKIDLDWKKDLNEQESLKLEFDAFSGQPLVTNTASIVCMFIDGLGIYTGISIEDENIATAVDMMLEIQNFKSTLVAAFSNPGADSKNILTQIGKAARDCSRSFISVLVQSGVIKESSESIVMEGLLAFATGGSSKILDAGLTANEHLPLMISMVSNLPKDKTKQFFIEKNDNGTGEEISTTAPVSKPRFSYEILDDEEPLAAPAEVRFDASDSCIYNENVEYHWQFEEGEEVEITDQPIINHIFGKGGKYTISLQIKNTDDDGKISEKVSESITIPGEVIGDIRATLRWSTHADIDLHAYNPNEEHIYYENMSDSLGGHLDHDIIPSEGDHSSHVENITWSAEEAIEGSYKFAVKYYNDPGNDDGVTATPVTVTITRNEGTPEEKVDTFTHTLTSEKEVWSVYEFMYPEGTGSSSIQSIEFPNVTSSKNKQ